MTEQTERLRRALRGCAERGISPTTEPWRKIEERLDARGAAPARRRPRFVPRPPLRVALAAALVLLFGMGAYAYAGFPMVRDVFREALPGGAGSDVGAEIGQELTDGGAKVTLEYAYADAGLVVVGYTVQDMRQDRTFGRFPSQLTPVQIDDSDRTPEEEKADLPPRVNLTDGSGRDFDLVPGSETYLANDPGALKQPKPSVAIFKPSEELEPGGGHRFGLKVVLEEGPILPSRFKGMIKAPRDGVDRPGPYDFDFEVPVRPGTVVEVGQEETAGGVTMTLERVLNSPGKPQAVVCFEPPDDDYEWRPSTAPTGFQTEEPLPVDRVEGGCWSLTLEDPVEGRSSVTVTQLFGHSHAAEAPRGEEEKRVRGPWTFEFEAPAP